MVDKDLRAGHRKRLQDKFNSGKLSDYELLEFFLTYAIPRCDVRPLAKNLYHTFGSMSGVITAPIEELIKFNGIQERTATFIKLLARLMQINFTDKMSAAPIFHDISDLQNYIRYLLGGKTKEEFHILFLGKEFELLACEMHSSGTSNWTAVYTREIVKRVLELNASSVILVHNHLHMQTSFSQDDIIMTERIIAALHELDVTVFDHYVLSGSLIYSMREMGCLNKSASK